MTLTDDPRENVHHIESNLCTWVGKAVLLYYLKERSGTCLTPANP